MAIIGAIAYGAEPDSGRDICYFARGPASAFLAAVDPLLDVISVGRANRYGHPAPEVLERLDGDAVFRTDLHGDVAISTDGRRLWIETGR